jgi:hypothetical protein
MTPSAGVTNRRSTNGRRAILWGGLLAGLGDITQAFVAFGLQFHLTPFRILQSIARGYFGPRAFQMGWTSATLGLASHFFIATTAAAVYYVASRKLKILTEHAVLCGLLYGEVVFLVMYFVVMPLTPIGWPRMPFGWSTWVTGPIGHPLLVGLPIALCVRRFGEKT